MNPYPTVFVPVRPLSELNSRSGEHWAKKKKRHDRIKEETFCALRELPLKVQEAIRSEGKLAVVLRAITAHKPDKDALGGAMKYYQDEVARFLGCDDAEESRVEFFHKWRKWQGLVNAKGKGGDCREGVYIDFIPFSAYLEEAKKEIEAQLAALSKA